VNGGALQWQIPDGAEPNTIRIPESGIHGLDELASRLGVSHGLDAGEWGVEGRSGKRYGIIRLFEAARDRMDQATRGPGAS
jgi:hypothetical protein